MVVVKSATSVKGIMILHNLNWLNAIRMHQVSWLGLELVSTAKPRFGSSLMVSRSIRNFIVTKF